LGLRDPEVLGLASGDFAVQLRVAEEGRPLAAVSVLGRLALGVQPFVAHEAVPARNVERHHDPVPDLQVRDSGPDRFDETHRLVPEDVALAHERPQNLVQVEVRSADSR
jgi:hypothetical protein